jgi:hypothetical protein
MVPKSDCRLADTAQLSSEASQPYSRAEPGNDDAPKASMLDIMKKVLGVQIEDLVPVSLCEPGSARDFVTQHWRDRSEEEFACVTHIGNRFTRIRGMSSSGAASG